MKRLLFIILFPSACFGQKIKINAELDKFTHQRRIETNTISLKSELFGYLAARLRSVDTTIFISLTGSGPGMGVGVVGAGDEVLFLLGNDSVVTIKSVGIQIYEIGFGKSGNHYSHQYYLYKKDLEALSLQELKSVRRYYNSNYTDIDIYERRQSALKELCTAFLKEFEKDK